MKSASRVGGISLTLFALACVAYFALDMSRVQLGFDDPDNPEQSVAFLAQHGRTYQISGMVQVLMSITLTAGTLAVAEWAGTPSHSLAVRIASAFGLFAAAFFLVNAALRFQGVGTLLYMDGLRHDWGLTNYLIVQIVGTQAFVTSAIVSLSIWVIGISLVGMRDHLLPRWLSVVGFLSAFRLLGLFGPWLGSAFDGLFIVYVLAIFVIMVWCLLLGILLLLRKPAR